MTRGRRTLGTLQVVALGAVAAAGCAGPLPDDTVEPSASSLSGPPPVSVSIGSPSSLFATVPSSIQVNVFPIASPPPPPPPGPPGMPPPPPPPPVNLSNVTIRTTLTGVPVAIGTPLGARSANPFVCTPDNSVPGTATITCVGSQMTGPFSLFVPLTATTPGTLTVTATVSVGMDVVASNTRPIIVLAADNADLSMSGFADSPVFVGSQASASFFANNAGPLNATGVTVTLALSGPGVFNSVTGPSVGPGPGPMPGPMPGPVPPGPAVANCTFTSNSATCTVGSFPVRAFLPINTSFTATGEGDVLITATISGNELDRAPFNNTFTTFTTAFVPKYADLSIALTAGHVNVVAKPLSYTITVTNKGPDEARSVVVDDTLPWGTTFVSATPSQGSCWGGEWGFITCDMGALAASAKATVALVVKPTAPAEITNTATVNDWYFGDFDLDYSNNEASATVSVHGAMNPSVKGPPTRGGCGLWPGAPIDSLEDGDLTLRRGSKEIGAWWVTSDGTGYQTPSSADGLVVPGGLGPSKYMVNSTGFGFWNWGAAFGLFLNNCSYDASRFRALRFDVKAGGTGMFFLEVSTIELEPIEQGGHCDPSTSTCFDLYRSMISVPTDGWYRCTVAFADLTQAGWGLQAPFNVGAVMGAQFNMETWQAPYDLSIDNLEFVASPKATTGCVRIGN